MSAVDLFILLVIVSVIVILLIIVFATDSKRKMDDSDDTIRQTRIVSAAVRMSDGLVFMTCREDIPKHLRELLQLRYGADYVDHIEQAGFMNSNEVFVYGQEAWDIAEKSGQIRYNRDQIKRTKQELWSIYLY